MNNDSIIFAGRKSKVLTKKICKYLKKEEELDFQGEVDIYNFPKGEIYSQYLTNVRGKDVYIVQSTYDANEAWMELFQLIHCAKYASAKTVTAIIPYFSYARQDRKDKPRTPISAKMVLTMLESVGVNRILTMDIHNTAIQGFTELPSDSLLPCNLIKEYFTTNFSQKNVGKEWICMSPDIGGIKKTEKYADMLGMDFGLVHKQRINASEVKHKSVIGDVKGKNVLLVDDMSETLGTLSGAAELLKESGASKIVAFVTHLSLTKKGVDNLKKEKNIDQLVTTNTIPTTIKNDRLIVIDTSRLLGEAIRRIANNKSISNLFEIGGY